MGMFGYMTELPSVRVFDAAAYASDDQPSINYIYIYIFGANEVFSEV